MCTRFLWNSNKMAVLSGRSMDWPESTQPLLIVFPRGRQRQGGLVGNHSVVSDNPLNWTSQYGSLVVSIYGIGAAEGLNEGGLAAHGLYLVATEYGERDPRKPGLQNGLWVQYVLDNAANVSEALELIDGFQPVMAEAHGFKATLHFAIEDAGGDSAIIEYVNGQPVVHHGREYTVMTNDPTYDEQLRLLKEQDISHQSFDTPLPGGVKASDRFQRASYYGAMLPEPTNEREAVAGMLSVIRNVYVPFGAPYHTFGIYNTEYGAVSDLTNRRLFFELTTSPNVIWTELDKFDLSPEAPVMTLDPYDYTLVGDVTAKYREATVAF